MKPSGPNRDLDGCIRLLEELAADRGRLASVDPERRRALLVAAGRLSRPQKHERIQLAKAFRRGERAADKAHDAALLEATEIRAAQRVPVWSPPPHRDHAPSPGVLEDPRACYVCKAPFTELHFFYDSMCPPCAETHYEKRFQTVSLAGRVALITGARVKIGYQAALMMLRAGARVVVTTRFPHDAARRYAREPDFEAFAGRLQIHGLDLRHAPSVELFTSWLSTTLGRLDLLINNAAQTVRRPPAFYQHLLAAELAAPEARSRPLLSENAELRAALEGEAPGAPGATSILAWGGGAAGVGLLRPAQLSQLALTPDDTAGAELFPMGAVDGDLQQVDLRPMNSWRLPASEVATPELLEVHLVNAIAPFLLASRLRPLMMRDPTGEKHIVNVSAMEAQFSRKKKTDKHPHTNMAKAALNMLTRTSAPDYAQVGIFMNSVDTGWVTDEDPMHHVTRKQRIHDFHPPLDVIDGAARVCDPFFQGLRSGKHPWGQFFKDYRPVAW